MLKSVNVKCFFHYIRVEIDKYYLIILRVTQFTENTCYIELWLSNNTVKYSGAKTNQVYWIHFELICRNKAHIWWIQQTWLVFAPG